MTQEILHFLQSYKRKKRIHWFFIREVLPFVKFTMFLTKLILQCISTTSLQFLINETRTPNFTPLQEYAKAILYHRTYLFFVWSTCLASLQCQCKETSGHLYRSLKIAHKCLICSLQMTLSYL